MFKGTCIDFKSRVFALLSFIFYFLISWTWIYNTCKITGIQYR
jgi:hypothetical protein